MFETLKRLYDEGKIDVAALDKAVTKNWITAEERFEIIRE